MAGIEARGGIEPTGKSPRGLDLSKIGTPPVGSGAEGYDEPPIIPQKGARTPGEHRVNPMDLEAAIRGTGPLYH